MRIEENINLLSQKWKKIYDCRVMKIGLSLGLTCPNREKGACIFCLPSTFTDEINDKNILTIPQQIDILLPKIMQKTKTSKFIAYLQDETTTACSINYLQESLAIIEKSNIFEEVIISTRPDYIDEDILKVIKSVNIPITIEIGMQTIHDSSLNFLNRNHTHQESIHALKMCEEFHIPTGVHLILGIPNETQEMNLETINFINKNKNISDVKIHNLVVYRETKLADIYQNHNFLSYEEYLELLAKIIGHLSPEKTISRLFTSNLRRDSLALNSFPGFKQIWLKDLWLLLKKKSIFQGSSLV